MFPAFKMLSAGRSANINAQMGCLISKSKQLRRSLIFLGLCLCLLLLAQILFVFSAQAESAPGAVKIGYVDLRKALEETSSGKKAKKELEKEYSKKKEELTKKEKDLKAMNDDLDKKKLVLSDEVRNKKQAELQQDIAKFQGEVQTNTMNLQKKERELTQPILEKLQDIIDKKAKEGNYTVVLEKSEQSVLWAKKDIDMTDEVVKAYEKAVTK